MVEQAQAAGIAFFAIVADCFYGDDRALEKALLDRSLPQGTSAPRRRWVPAEADHSFKDAAQALPLRAWREVIRRFTDGHTERWWAAELTLFGYGPNKPVRAVCATTDRRALPALSTWYLTTNLPPEQAPLGEVVRLYGLRNWVEQSYKQMKDELGWALLLVRSDRAIRRHWTWVVLCVCLLLVARCRSKPPQRLVHTTGRYADNATQGGEKKPAAPRRCRAGRACCARCAPG